jgi:N-acetylglucosaminyldiphosphoundecaprenol N-acetyl-beta-D-mannosaminyltransferase
MTIETQDQPMDDAETTDLLGLPLARVTVAQFIEWTIARAAERRAPARIGYLNAAQVNLAFDSPDFAATLRRFDLLYADGQAVVWASRLRGPGAPERVNAGDFTREFFQACARAGLSVALVGGYPGDADRFAERYERETEGFKFRLKEHGFFKPEEAESVHERIEAADPDIALIAMGAPRQERIALEWSERGRPRVWWCVGALFEYDSGRRRRAPKWIRRVGLEWLFRLAMEPGRLWRRYLIGNPKFVWRVVRGRAAK